MKYLMLLSILLALFVTIFFMQRPSQNEEFSEADLNITQTDPSNKESIQQSQNSILEENFLPETDNSDTSHDERDRLVSNKLNKFLERTASITADRVAHEREKISRGLHEIYNKQERMPNSTRIIDEHGDTWEKLNFGNGVVRYLPISEGEKNL